MCDFNYILTAFVVGFFSAVILTSDKDYKQLAYIAKLEKTIYILLKEKGVLKNDWIIKSI